MIDPKVAAGLRLHLHALRNHMTAILPNAQLMVQAAEEMRDMGEDVVRAAKQLRDAVDRMLEVVQDAEADNPPTPGGKPPGGGEGEEAP